MSETLTQARLGLHASSFCLLEWGARRLVLQLADHLQEGEITLVEDDTRHVFRGQRGVCGLACTIHVHNHGFYCSLIFGGNVGVAESYMSGQWTCDDLFTLIRIVTRNGQLYEGLDRSWLRVLRPLHALGLRLRRNTRTGARRNIAAHYDLGNDFYKLMLDETMTYSSGLYATPAATLRQASEAKIDRLCRKLDLRPQDHLLEIGTGWGGFALHAARHYGCRVTTTTISRAQHDEASARIAAAGLSERVTVLLEDYRDLRGTYDKLVSVEMIEAVGHQYLDDYFAQCSRLLKPEGAFGLQAILTSDQIFPRMKDKPDFINRYIFPGGCLPSLAAIMNSVARVSDLRVHHLESLAEHYAATLLDWRKNFYQHLDQVRALQFDERFVRMWDLYLSYCAGAFAERRIGVAQLVLTKPRNRLGTPELAPIPALEL